ncbi:MAG: type I DNA topoisomerase [Bacteroidetes bacterium]|nr:type I DNA topoisomerase [Bacteroidota bacterium]
MSKKNLVIVESPAKAKTIEKYLGNDFLVKSSYGHIRDLDKGDNAIDLNNNYQPKYVIPSDKQKLVSELKKLTKEAETIWLASDDDREGEAISWHLSEVLDLKAKDTKRIVFNEITKPAIEHAIQNPRAIDTNLVNAQQARRVLDRLVGYELSPLLWKKVKPSLSAGRVQSVAVRLVVEKEREIRDFNITSDYRVTAIFSSANSTFKAVLNKRFEKESDALAFLEMSNNSSFKVKSIETKPVQRNPSPPFTTSTLQQEASRKFGTPVGTTMQLAQKLYEEGHITYMRTDSLNLSDIAIGAAKNTIINEFGNAYSQVRKYTTKTAGAQEAHEAIRPTNFNLQHAGETEREKKLYNLIWKRAIASQMASAKLEKTTIEIECNNHNYLFIAEGEVIKFDGFLKGYIESNDDDESEETEGLLPKLQKSDAVVSQEITAEEKYLRPPARYTEASLVKKLEELGIGRPSTYAPTISTIQKRGYVEIGKKEGIQRESKVFTLKNHKIISTVEKEKTGSDKGKLVPSDIGMLVTDFLSEHFKNIMDYGFTAAVEKEFDDIASGLQTWSKMIDKFYHPFHQLVAKTESSAERITGEREIGIDPKSGKKIVAKMGKFGAYVQIVEPDENKKSQFASLRAGQSIETIKIEEALELFKLPRTIGIFENSELIINIGRFGPYVLHNKKFYSLPKSLDPLIVNESEAIGVIEAKRSEDKNADKLPLQLGNWNAGSIEINKGRFGPYVKYQNKYFSLPKGTNLFEVTKEQAIEIINSKMVEEEKKIIKRISIGEQELVVQNGRYGPYFTFGGNNYKLGNIQPEALTREQAEEIINNTPTKASKKKRKKQK